MKKCIYFKHRLYKIIKNILTQIYVHLSVISYFVKISC
jgi:hypothetical protein